MAPTPVQTPNFSRPLPSPYLKNSPGSPPAVARQQNAALSEPSVKATTVPTSPLSLSMPIRKQTTRPNAVRQQQRALAAGGHDIASSPQTEIGTEKSLKGLRDNHGDMKKPMMEFCPEAWPSLDRNRAILKIDLFWPIKPEDMNHIDEDNDLIKNIFFPVKELKPILTFRNLHVLHISGMMITYQPTIWEVCWLNKNLTTLTLEMALEPEFKDTFKPQYKKIDGNWAYDGSKQIYTEPTEYLGAFGQGNLHKEFGTGEYLDRNAMKQAQVDIVRELPLSNMRYLPLTSLTLSNFAVDAGPFFRWFDPVNFKELTFKGTCWDTGFYLPNEMRKVVVVKGPPKPKVALPPAPVGAKGNKPGELNVVTFSKGRIVKREAWDGKNHLPDVEEALVAGGAGVGGVGGGGGKVGAKK